MNNLKRILSLALASVMVLGMMVVGASAAEFTDSDKIAADYANAVETMHALGIINGFDDGSFQPEGTLTRAQMAMMLATIFRNGRTDFKFAVKEKPSFTDVKSTAWYAGPVEYATNMKIINGRGNGIFDPESTVTGVEAARMILNAMGYEQGEGDWSLNTVIQAEDVGLYEGVAEADQTAEKLTRQAAAQMLCNAINADMAEGNTYQATVSAEVTKYAIKKADGDTAPALAGELLELSKRNYDSFLEAYTMATSVTGKKIGTDFKIESVKVDEGTKIVTKTETLGHKYLSLNDVTGVLVSVNLETTGLTKGLYKVVTTKGTFYTKADTCSEMVGELVQVLYKSQTNVYGIIAGGSALYYEGTVGELKAQLPYIATTTQAALSAATTYEWNTATETTWTAEKDSYNLKITQTGRNPNTGAPIFTAVVKSYDLGTVTYLSATNITVSGANISNAKLTAVELAEGIKNGDQVVVVPAKHNADGKAIITKPETVVGKITGVKDTNTVQVEGNWYVKGGNDALTSTDLGSEKALTVVNGYYVAATNKAGIAATDVLWATKIANKSGLGVTGTEAQVVLPDGTKTIVDVKVTGTAEGLYTYYVQNGVYNLTRITTSNAADAGYVNLATGAFVPAGTNTTATVGGKRIADDATIVVMYSDGTPDVTSGTPGEFNEVLTGEKSYSTLKTTVLTGAQLKAINKNFGDTVTEVLTTKVNGIEYVKLAFIVTSRENLPGTKGDVSYGLVISDVTYSNDGTKTYAEYTVWNGVADVNVKDEAGTASTAAYGEFIQFDDKGNGIIETNTASVVTGLTPAAITGYSATDKIIDVLDDTGANTLTLTNDTKIFYIDSSKGIGVQSSGIPTATTNAYGALVKNAEYKLDNGELAFLVIDVNNNLVGEGAITPQATLGAVKGADGNDAIWATKEAAKAAVAALPDGIYKGASAGENNGLAEMLKDLDGFDDADKTDMSKAIYVKFNCAKNTSYKITFTGTGVNTSGTYTETMAKEKVTSTVGIFYWAASNGTWLDGASGTITYKIEQLNSNGTAVATVLVGSFTK